MDWSITPEHYLAPTKIGILRVLLALERCLLM